MTKEFLKVKPREFDDKLGLLLFENGYGEILEKSKVIWDGDDLTPAGMKGFHLHTEDQKTIQVQPQLVFRPVVLVISSRPDDPKYLARVIVESFKVGAEETLAGQPPILLFHRSQLFTLELPTCRIEQRISIKLHNMSPVDVILKVWLEGRYIEGYKG